MELYLFKVSFLLAVQFKLYMYNVYPFMHDFFSSFYSFVVFLSSFISSFVVICCSRITVCTKGFKLY